MQVYVNIGGPPLHTWRSSWGVHCTDARLSSIHTLNVILSYWCLMVSHGVSYSLMVTHGDSWCLMVSHGVS